MVYLDEEDTKRFISIIETIHSCGIESFVIDSGKVRAANRTTSCVIISDKNVPEFKGKLGITRVPTFLKQLKLFSDKITLSMKENVLGDILELEIREGKSKLNYKCATPSLILAPKEFEFTSGAKIILSEEDSLKLIKASKSMNAENIVVSIMPEGNSEFYVKDALGDNYHLQIDDNVVTDLDTSVTFSYLNSNFSNVLKLSNLALDIDTRTGAIKFDILGHDVIVTPVFDREME